MYTASQGYELQIASVTALVLMVPGAVLLLLLERVLRAEYLTFFARSSRLPIRAICFVGEHLGPFDSLPGVAP